MIRLKEDDSPVEDSDDYYAQDDDGAVWYLGGITKNLEVGELVDLERSRKAGRDSARAGMLMVASPVVGDVYRQELALGDAEGLPQVLSLDGTAMMPAAGPCRPRSHAVPDEAKRVGPTPASGLAWHRSISHEYVASDLGGRLQSFAMSKQAPGGGQSMGLGYHRTGAQSERSSRRGQRCAATPAGRLGGAYGPRRRMVVLAAAITVLALSPRETAALTPLCTNTAEAAFKAGLAEVDDDHWTALAYCNNLRRGLDRKQCRQDAGAERRTRLDPLVEETLARLDGCSRLGEAAYDPVLNPLDFVDPLQIGAAVDPNPYLPLVPGTLWVYENLLEDIAVTVTAETKTIDGVVAIVVREVVKVAENGPITRDAEHWYAQHKDGNVWNLGQIVQHFEDGELVDINGSWKAGRDGAKAGIVMLANPAVGDLYRQAFALGVAESLAEVASLTATTTTPVASCGGANPPCLVTDSFSAVEPDGFESAYYAPGLGLILKLGNSVDILGATELVDFTTP